MLSQLKLTRFKSISKIEDVELRNFSILCGSNSSGKSSFIQAILMLSQTFGSRYDQDTMVLNGHLVRLGSFSDIKTHKTEEDSIDISFTIDSPIIEYGLSKITGINCKFNFGQGSKRNRPIYSEHEFHPPINRIEITLQLTHGEIKRTEKIILRLPPSSITDQYSYSNITKTDIFDVEFCSLSDLADISKEYPGYKILGCAKNSTIPHMLHIEYDHGKKMSAAVIDRISGNLGKRITFVEKVDDSEINISKNFLICLKSCIESEFDSIMKTFEIELPKQLSKEMARQLGQNGLNKIKNHLARAQLNISPDTIERLIERRTQLTLQGWNESLKTLEEKEKRALSELIDKYRNELQKAWYSGSEKEIRTVHIPLKSVFYLNNYLATYFSRSIKYLGPLRSEPQAVYTSLGHTDPNHVGLKGEYTAAALHINKDKSISYPSPILKDNENFSFIIKQSSLHEACREWLEYLGVVVDYRTRDRGKLGYEIYVKTHKDGHWQDLTHVGVGVSQVLPIVLMFLLSQTDDFLIFEQPELHLHPKIQSRLCDFFTAMSSNNRQCLIETHSEYLITRLRLRIAQSRDDSLIKKSSVFFVRKVNGLSNFTNVNITKYGVIPDWPEDFFDQTDEEIQKLLIEATLKKNEERRRSSNAIGTN